MCIGIVCSPSTAVPGLGGGGTLTIAGNVGLVSLGSRVLKRICAFAIAGNAKCWFLAPLQRFVILDLTGSIFDGQI